jgi:hypothetical protein
MTDNDAFEKWFDESGKKEIDKFPELNGSITIRQSIAIKSLLRMSFLMACKWTEWRIKEESK